MTEAPERIFAYRWGLDGSNSGWNAFKPAGVHTCTAAEYVRADLYAALEAQLAEGVKVKQLEWVEIAEGPRCITPCGTYAIHPSVGAYGRPTLSLTGMPGDLFGKFDTIEAAKAAAQADYECRILSALEAIPPAPKAGDVIREFASKQSSTDSDIQASISDRSEMYHTAAQEAGKP